MRADGNDIKRAVTAEDLQVHREEQFERALVERLCNRYKVSMPRLIEKMTQIGLGHRPTLAGWSQVFTNWPIYLECSRVKDVAEDGSVARLFRDFTRRKLFREFVAVDEDRPSDVAHTEAGLCVPWPYLGRRNGVTEAMVLHTGFLDLDTPGTRMIWVPPPELEHAEPLVMETFSRVLAAIDATEPRGRWRPE